MSLPQKAEKEYLELTDAGIGFTIEAEPQHAAELLAILQQHGVPCRLESEVSPGHDALVLTQVTDVAQVKEILDAYKHATGS